MHAWHLRPWAQFPAVHSSLNTTEVALVASAKLVQEQRITGPDIAERSRTQKNASETQENPRQQEKSSYYYLIWHESVTIYWPQFPQK